MIYPDGRSIHIGDRVWWDGGISIGYIREIHDSSEKLHSSGMDELGISISMISNFDIEAPYVGYPQRLLADDGIELLTKEENEKIDNVINAAINLTSAGPASDIGIYLDYEGNTISFWYIVHYYGTTQTAYALPPSLNSANKLNEGEIRAFYCRSRSGRRSFS